MAIYELNEEQIVRIPATTFDGEGVKERADLQRLLRTNIDVVSPETLVIAEEFGQWQDSKRRIDLLGLDKIANLVVIELKRTEDGGHMELQAIRYAAMVSTMTFEQAVAARAEFQSRHGIDGDAEQRILQFLGWEEPDEDQFAQAVRIVLVSPDFSKELTTAVMWLNNHDLDIRCVRMKPYILDGRKLLDVQQVIPLPEVAEYQVQVKEKTQKERKSRKGNIDYTRYDVSICGTVHAAQWKRRAALLVARTLVKHGATPEEIDELLSWRGGTVWWKLDGDVDSHEFIERAKHDASVSGRTFDTRRWFVEDDELVNANGATYAFTNQWGSHWPKAMKVMAERCPELEITFTPTKAGNHG